MPIGRKRSELSTYSEGAAANIAGATSIFSGFNSSEGEAKDKEIIQVKEPLLSLEIEDNVLRQLTIQWQREYDIYYKDIKSRQDDNYNYWLGKQFGSAGNDSRGTDNVIFESSETLLPIVSRQNPEPNTTADSTPDGDFLSDMTNQILMRKADESCLKSKIKNECRNWLLYFLGCFKMGWDTKKDDMFFQAIDPCKLILDPKGYFDGGEFCGRYIGEKKSATAEDLVTEFPKFKEDIKLLVGEKMGSILNYIEWWTDEYVFWQLNTIILDKRKNPYWNDESKVEQMDSMGQLAMQPVSGINHFASPKMPYSFLSVFNTGKQPHDETSLIEQCKSLQDIVNKRLRQIDKNADETNNGWVFNRKFSQNQAKEAVDAVKRGGAIIAPTEDIRESVQRLVAPELASYVYNDMQDKREQIYNIMGIRGSTAQGIMNEQTVRGKIEIKGQDVDRLALVVEQVEQFVDHLYNLAVQTVYVYYTEENAIRVLGAENGLRYLQLLKAGPSRRLVVTVKEGSMVPKDPLTRRNEAMDLWGAGASDPETLFEDLQKSDPKERALKLLTYLQNPQQYTVDLGGVPPPVQMDAMGQPVPIQGVN